MFAFQPSRVSFAGTPCTRPEAHGLSGPRCAAQHYQQSYLPPRHPSRVSVTRGPRHLRKPVNVASVWQSVRFASPSMIFAIAPSPARLSNTGSGARQHEMAEVKMAVEHRFAWTRPARGPGRDYFLFACPFSLWCLFTVRAAISLARLVERPCSSSLSLMCSYMRCSLSLTLGKCCFRGTIVTSWLQPYPRRSRPVKWCKS